MKKLFILSALFIFMGSINMFSQDLEEILESHFDVIGQEKILEYQSFVSKGRVVQMGMEFPMALYKKRPGKMRMEAEIQGTKMIQGFDGETGWAIIPWTGNMEPQTMGEEETKALKQMADIDGELYNWEEKGYELSLMGEDDMEGTPVYKIKLVKDEGDEYIYYIDSENFVILRADAKVMVNGAEVESSSFFSNFKPVSGMIMPHSIETKMNDQLMSQIVIDSVEVDVELEDSLFAKPETTEE